MMEWIQEGYNFFSTPAQADLSILRCIVKNIK